MFKDFFFCDRIPLIKYDLMPSEKVKHLTIMLVSEYFIELKAMASVDINILGNTINEFKPHLEQA